MKLFVWDFHGVLEKGNEHSVLEITNLALASHGYSRRMTTIESAALSGLRWYEYFTFLLPEIGEKECLQLQSTCLEISYSQPEIVAKYIQLNDHANDVLKQIQETSHHQILISNSSLKSLDIFVHLVGIQDYFPEAYRFGVDSHTQKATTKKECLAQFLKGKDHFNTIISIGDSPGDMALINQENGRKGIGYLYSYPDKPHRPAKCDYQINDLRVVLRELSGTPDFEKSIQYAGEA